MDVIVARNRSVEEHRNFTFIAFPLMSLPDQFSLKFRVNVVEDAIPPGCFPAFSERK
jgi:hypothetical protein